jgi:hypothetical protein
MIIRTLEARTNEAVTVRNGLELVNRRILKFATAINSDRIRKVTLPNSRMTRRSPAAIRQRRIRADHRNRYAQNGKDATADHAPQGNSDQFQDAQILRSLAVYGRIVLNCPNYPVRRVLDGTTIRPPGHPPEILPAGHWECGLGPCPPRR